MSTTWIMSQILIAGLAVWAATKYLVEFESGDWVHRPVDSWLYQAGEKAGGRFQTFAEFLRYGWNCTKCVGQWVAFAAVWALSGVPPWEWGFAGFVTAVAVNAVNVALTIFEKLLKDLKPVEPVELEAVVGQVLNDEQE